MPPDPEPGSRRGQRLLTVLTVATVAAALVALAAQWTEVSPILSAARPGWIAVSFLTGALAVGVQATAWGTLVTGAGAHSRPVDRTAVYATGQLGKYVPGGIWTVLAHAEAGRASGLSRASTGSASLIAMIITLGTGVIVGAGALFGSSGGLGGYWWLALVLAACVVALHPRVITMLLRIAAKVLRRDVIVPTITWATLSRAVAWTLVGWIVFGTHLYAVAQALEIEADGMFARSIGAYALAWAVGFVVVFAPAGVGVREVAMVAVLGPTIDDTAAVALAITSRLVLTAADLGWGAWGIAMIRSIRRRSIGERAPSPQR